MIQYNILLQTQMAALTQHRSTPEVPDLSCCAVEDAGLYEVEDVGAYIRRRCDFTIALLEQLSQWMADSAECKLRRIAIQRDWSFKAALGRQLLALYQTILSPSRLAKLRQLTRQTEAFGELCARRGIVF